MLRKNFGFIKGRYVYLLQMLLVALFLTGCEISSPQTKAVIDVSATHVATGTNVVFNASASSGGKGQIVSYVWKDETNNVVLNETVTFSHAFMEIKKHTISLTVVNTLGESSQAEVVIDVYSADTTPPVITLNGESNMTLMVGDTYIEPGATAIDTADGSVSVDISGIVDTNIVGIYIIKYSAKDKAGNTATAVRAVTVKESADTVPPVIILNGEANVTLVVGDTYTELGATAVDARDGNVSIDVNGTVETSKVGTYTITYSAKDKAGNTATAVRTVTVKEPADMTPPVITLNGDSNITLKVGDTYIELGATAIDDRDGNISDKIQIAGNVDTNTTGTYTVKYSIADNAGNSANIQRVVNVKEDNNTTTIEKLKDILNDPTIPYTTDADFNKTEYAKHHLPEEEAKKLERAHYLVATAKDPDPTWFYTDVDKSVIVTQAGTEHTITLKKMRKDGTVYAPVDNDKLRLVVRVQRSKDEFEYITNVNIDQYAHWDSAGVLKINVPQDLDKGRLIVGVRPNLTDVAASAMAERWSAVISAEIMKVKSGVKQLDSANVLFPVDNESLKYLSPESKFSHDEIFEKVDEKMSNEHLFTFPLVVKEIELKKDDMVSYIFKDSPRFGKVIAVEHKDNQTFVLLSPDMLNVYEVTDINDSSMKKEGLVPEYVVIREGDRLVTDQNETDPIKFESMSKSAIGDVVDFFRKHCVEGDSVLTFAITPSFSPLDIGVDVGLIGAKKETKCTFEARSDPMVIHPSWTGGPGALILRALGARYEVGLYGNLEIVTKDAAGFGFDAGYTLVKGGHFKALSTHYLGSRKLEDEAKVATGEVSVNAGVKMTLIGLDLPEFYGKKETQETGLGLEAQTGLQAKFVASAKNAAEVLKSSSSSMVLTASVDGKVGLTQGFKILAEKLGFEIKAELPFNEDLIEPIKGNIEFTFASVSDDGSGTASLVGLHAKNSWIDDIFGSPQGVLSLKDSSVWDNISENITYDLDECAQDPDYKIVSPAIGCAGWMCGVVDKDVVLCKGKLSISDVYASARVGELAKAEATIVNKAGDITVDITGSPLEPTTKTLEMSADSEAKVLFQKVCPDEPGVYRNGEKEYTGKSTVTAQGIDLSAEAKNVMVCTKDENKGDPHITTGDGLGYDYYASGDYVLSRILDSDGNRVWGYEIQARFLPGFKTSWPQAVALQVGADRVEIQGRLFDKIHATYAFNALKVWVNGKEVNNPNPVVKLPSGGVLAMTENKLDIDKKRYPTSITIIWPEGTPTQNYGLVVNVTEAPTQPFIETLIARPDTFAGQERGLLGNNDGNPKNDFIRRNGEVLGVDHNMSFTELYALFGSDWLAKPYESLFRNPEAIKPEFPTDVVTLTPEQRALGEQACAALTGFYREACIIDVGLSGSVDLVKEYYANTDDLNALSDAIVTPDVDMAMYEMQISDKVYMSDSTYYLHYTQEINISKISGKGQFALMIRPPRGATVSLSNGELSYAADGNYSTAIEVDCTTLNPETDKAYFSAEGAVQLWRQDPLSGTLKELISQDPLPCTDASKRPKYTLNLGTKEEQADSNDTHQHYTRQLMVKHESVDNGEFILDVTAPEGAIVKLNGSTTELNATGTGDYNASLELDCTNQTEINRNKGSIKLWGKDTLTQNRGYLYANSTLSCQKSKVLKTGQTTSYYPHDDGDYQMGEERSYTRDDAKEVVVDNVTGLMWQDNSEAKTVTKPWVMQDNYDAGKYDDTSGDTAATYCENLELGGYTDWRLPTFKELESIVDYGKANPAIDTTYFNNVSSNYYWSATTSQNSSGYAWIVDFYYGGSVSNFYKNYNHYIRCVRAGQ